MKTLEDFKLSVVSVAVVLALLACEKPGPAENAGKKLDQASESVGRTASDTAAKAEKTMQEQGARTAAAISDTEITGRVKAAILAEPGLKTLEISVDTVKGMVTLTGTADSQASSDRARTLAAAVPGVSDVANRLKLAAAK